MDMSMNKYYTCNFGKVSEIRCTCDPYYCWQVDSKLATQIVEMLNEKCYQNE